MYVFYRTHCVLWCSNLCSRLCVWWKLQQYPPYIWSWTPSSGLTLSMSPSSSKPLHRSCMCVVHISKYILGWGWGSTFLVLLTSLPQPTPSYLLLSLPWFQDLPALLFLIFIFSSSIAFLLSFLSFLYPSFLFVPLLSLPYSLPTLLRYLLLSLFHPFLIPSFPSLLSSSLPFFLLLFSLSLWLYLGRPLILCSPWIWW